MHDHHLVLSLLVLVAGCPADDSSAGDTGNADSEAQTTDAQTTDAQTTDASSEASGDTSPIEIIGEYDDDFGGHHEISMETWIYDSGEFGVFTTNLMTHDNAEHWVAGEDAAMAGTFVRFDWTTDGEGTLWYCQAVFDATSLQDAIDAPLSDASAPAEAGCGGMFPWTMLIPA